MPYLYFNFACEKPDGAGVPGVEVTFTVATMPQFQRTSDQSGFVIGSQLLAMQTIPSDVHLKLEKFGYNTINLDSPASPTSPYTGDKMLGLGNVEMF